MADRLKVPQFGNWENEEIPYTICFDNSTKGKKSGQLYQNDPQENLEVDSKSHKISEPRRSNASPLHPNVQFGSNKSESKALNGHRFKDSPLHHEAAGRKMTSGENTPRRGSRQNRSIENSPMHPISHARVGGKSSGFSSPSWERKGASERSPVHASLTPGRSRLRSVKRGSEMPDHSPAIPKFGEWDETDPASAQEYSHIFSRVKEEKNGDQTGKVPVMTNETAYYNAQKNYGNDHNSAKGCSCFPWGKK